MKRRNLFTLLAVCLLCAVSSGCKKTPVGLTQIPGSNRMPDGTGPRGPLDGRSLTDPGVGVIPLTANPEDLDKFNQDRDTFQSSTAYFDLDSAAVKAADKTKVEAVANYFRSNANDALLVEGHCDERGTEGYNLSLGEKRALALREYLANLGVGADRIHTRSYGESRPAVPGQSESAYSKNRRGEFILLKPK